MIAFNTALGWSRDVSEEFANEIAQRCAMDGFNVRCLMIVTSTWSGLGGHLEDHGKGLVEPNPK